MIREVDGVADAAVVGAPDEVTGEAVVAYVVPVGGVDKARTHLEEAVRAHAVVRLARFKQPTRIEVVDELPGHRDRQGAEGPAARPRAPPGPGTPRMKNTRMSAPRITFYTRPGCHLCDDARVVVERVCADLGESFEEVDITTDDDLADRFGEDVPVTFVDGKQHDFWRVDENRLRAALG